MRFRLRSHPSFAVVLMLLVSLGAGACGGDDAAEPRSSTPETGASKAAGSATEDAEYVNGLVLAAANVGSRAEQVAVWTGVAAPKLGTPSELGIDPPLGAQPRTSRNGDTLAWLAGTAGAPQLWLIAGEDDPKLVGLTGDDGALDVRSMDVSGDGASLVVSTLGEAEGDSDALWLVDVASGGARRIDQPAANETIEFHDVSASTDASLIALRQRSTSCDPHGDFEICSSGLAMLEVAPDRPAPTKLVYAEGQGGPALDLRLPTFSQDDELLLYASGTLGGVGGVVVAISSIPVEQLLEQFDDIEPETIVTGLRDVLGYTISPDGELIAVTTAGSARASDGIEVFALVDGKPYTAATIAGAGTPVWVPADEADETTVFTPR